MRDLRSLNQQETPWLNRLKSRGRKEPDPMQLLYGGDRNQIGREVSRPNKPNLSALSRTGAITNQSSGMPASPASPPASPASPQGGMQNQPSAPASPQEGFGEGAGLSNVSSMTPVEAYENGLDDNLLESLNSADDDAKQAFTWENINMTTQTLSEAQLDSLFPNLIEFGEEYIKNHLYTDPVTATRDVVQSASSNGRSSMTQRLIGQ